MEDALLQSQLYSGTETSGMLQQCNRLSCRVRAWELLGSGNCGTGDPSSACADGCISLWMQTLPAEKNPAC